MKPQEIIPFPVGCRLRLLGTQTEPEFALQYLRDQIQRLLRLLGVLTEHHEVIGIPREAIAGLVESPVQAIEHDVRKQW
jgi:hypothetical protein